MRKDMAKRQFRGFTPEALQFLHDVKANNNKEWYEEHKPDYRGLLLHPFQDLVGDLSPLMSSVDPHIVTIPAVDKTISRIYRDTRFSTDKSRYRDAMWLAFKRSSKDGLKHPYFILKLPRTGTGTAWVSTVRSRRPWRDSAVKSMGHRRRS